jgi:DNA-binding protein YbaB
LEEEILELKKEKVRVEEKISAAAKDAVKEVKERTG